MLEGDLLTVCTPKGRVIKTYRLWEMNEMYAFVGQGRSCFISKCLLLYPKDMIFREGWMTRKGECLPYITIWMEINGKEVVAIENKALEEKILAYYGEKPIEDQD